MSTPTTPWFIGEDMLETITGLNASGVFADAAVVNYAIFTDGGASVPGGTGTYVYDAGSQGNYRTTIGSTVTAALSEGAVYHLDATIVSGTDHGFRRLFRIAKYRGAT